MKEFLSNFFKKLFRYFKILLLVAIIALIIKAFAFDAFQIPSSSMENTLLPGDFIFVSKFSYNLSTPKELPILGVKIPHSNLFEFGKPEISDVVIFEFPKGFSSDSLRGDLKYIKRIIAASHDTLKIISKKIYRNGKLLELPVTFKTAKNLPGDESNKNLDGYIYGPIVIPGKGDTIKITPENFDLVQSIIVMDYGERALLAEGTLVTLNGKPITEYVLTQDHYFVVGDNFELSMDSRHFGFITEDMIIGKAMFVYWSYDSEKVAPGPLGFLSAIRANRIFNGIN